MRRTGLLRIIYATPPDPQRCLRAVRAVLDVGNEGDVSAGQKFTRTTTHGAGGTSRTSWSSVNDLARPCRPVLLACDVVLREGGFADEARSRTRCHARDVAQEDRAVALCIRPGDPMPTVAARRCTASDCTTVRLICQCRLGSFAVCWVDDF